MITIQNARIDDLEILLRIGRETFIETFAANNTQEDMEKYLSGNFYAEKIISELQNPDSEFYIAYDGTVPIGYLKLNSGEAQTEAHPSGYIEIERIYVKSDYHGKKVGQLLYDKALLIAEDKNMNYIWLGVWEENPRAIRFYEKNGFTEFGKHIFKMGDDEQTDIMMRKKL